MAQLALFLLTAIYFIRPYEWVPGLIGVRLFLIVILPCLVIYFGAWTSQLSESSLRRSPISACVVGIFCIAFVSEMMNLFSLTATLDFAKSVMLYLLLTGLLITDQDLRKYLKGLAAVFFVQGLLIWLNHHGILAIGGEDALRMAGVYQTGSGVRLASLGGASFDPNDTAALMVLGSLLSLHFVLSTRSFLFRGIWLALALSDLYVLQLTDSRGGFLSFMVGAAVYIWSRWGKKGLLWGACLLPIVAAKLATARMAGIGSALIEDTGQSRMQFWTSALVMLKQNPIFGVGPEQFTSIVGKAAHNSFLQAFAELGFLGGTFFLGAFGYAFWTLFTMRHALVANAENPDLENPDLESPDPVLRADLSLLLALIGAYGMAILALNHLYLMNTYVLLAAATVGIRNFASENEIPLTTWFLRFCGLSVLFLLFSKLMVVLLVRW